MCSTNKEEAKLFLYQIKYKYSKDENEFFNANVIRGVVKAHSLKEAKAEVLENIASGELKSTREAKEGDFVCIVREVKESLCYTGSKKWVEDFYKERICPNCGRVFNYYITGAYGDCCTTLCSKEYKKKKENDTRLQEGLGVSATQLPPVIYRIENKKNGKNYIGKTRRAFTLRWWEHCRSWIPQEGSLSDFSFHIMEVCKENITDDELSIKEERYIRLYNARNPKCGYNTRSERVDMTPSLFGE